MYVCATVEDLHERVDEMAVDAWRVSWRIVLGMRNNERAGSQALACVQSVRE
jgi:hypothetical protein